MLATKHNPTKENDPPPGTGVTGQREATGTRHTTMSAAQHQTIAHVTRQATQRAIVACNRIRTSKTTGFFFLKKRAATFTREGKRRNKGERNKKLQHARHSNPCGFRFPSWFRGPSARSSPRRRPPGRSAGPRAARYLTWRARRCGRGGRWSGRRGRARAGAGAGARRPGGRSRGRRQRRGCWRPLRSASGRRLRWRRRLPQAFLNGRGRGGRGARSTCGPAPRRGSTATSCRPCAGTARAPAPCCCGSRSTGSPGPSLQTHSFIPYGKQNKTLIVPSQTRNIHDARNGTPSGGWSFCRCLREGKRWGPKEEAATLFQMGSTRCTGTGAPAAK